MTRDYSRYTISELEESLRAVDERRYPENKAAIKAELEARVKSGEFDREIAANEAAKTEKAVSDKAFVQKARVVIAWYLILSPIVILSYFEYFTTGLFTWTAAALIGSFAVFLAVSHWAGIGLLKGKPWAHWAAVGLLSAQFLRISSDAVYFQILSFAGIYATFGEGGDIGVAANIEPGFRFFQGNQMPFEIGVNVLSILMVYYLVAARRNIESVSQP